MVSYLVKLILMVLLVVSTQHCSFFLPWLNSQLHDFMPHKHNVFGSEGMIKCGVKEHGDGNSMGLNQPRSMYPFATDLYQQPYNSSWKLDH